MSTLSSSAAAPVSLRKNFAWTVAGNVVYGAGQWAILSLIAKLGTAEMLGQYALALAVATPVAMLSHLNLRAVLATDIARRHRFGDYLVVRLATTAIALLATAAIVWTSPLRAVTVVLGIALASENVSDTFFGAIQRRERMSEISHSLMARALVSTAALGVALWLTGSLLWAVVALAAGRIAVLLAYDCPRGEREPAAGFRSQRTILAAALPLGVALMLSSLTANLPRYAIERWLGTRELGVFAAAASFLTAGAALVIALGHSATPRLATYCNARDLPRFRALALRVIAISAAIGVAGVAGAAIVGGALLRSLYRPEFAAYQPLFVAVMAAAIPHYVSVMIGFVITSARSFAPQVPLLAAAAGSAALASWALVPRAGLYGAAWAIGIAACVQIAGGVFVLRRAVQGVRA